jgi:uncharacterized damage-inducible protein DinB
MSVRVIVAAMITGVSFTLAGCGGGAPAEQAAPAQEPAAAAEASNEGGAQVRADLIKDWERQKGQLHMIADAMPEDKFGYKSTPAQRSFGEQIMHVAQVNVKFLQAVGGNAQQPAFMGQMPKTKAEIMSALDQSYDYAIALLNEQTDASIMGTVDAGFLGQSSRARVFWFLLGHSMDIYGQMAVYLRLNDIVPPASRGV